MCMRLNTTWTERDWAHLWNVWEYINRERERERESALSWFCKDTPGKCWHINVNYNCCYTVSSPLVDCVWNVMAHAQKPDYVFRRKRVLSNRRRRLFSQLLAAEVCASAVVMVVMLDTPCSEVVWRGLTTHSIRQFPLQFPSRASPCAITFQLDSNSTERNPFSKPKHTWYIHVISTLCSTFWVKSDTTNWYKYWTVHRSTCLTIHCHPMYTVPTSNSSFAARLAAQYAPQHIKGHCKFRNSFLCSSWVNRELSFGNRLFSVTSHNL